jgi:hypothetical protein
MREPGAWQEANQAGLVAALRPVHAALLRYAGAEDDSARREEPAERVECDTVNALCTLFELSGFERAILLLCAGVELDGRFARACAAANGDPKRGHATFGLALAALAGAHWSALSRQQPLRYWRLLEVLPGDTLAVSALKIDERILHFLVGIDCMDERLEGIVQRMQAPEPPGYLLPAASKIARVMVNDYGALRRVRLAARSAADRRTAAAAGFAAAGIATSLLHASDIPAAPADRENVLRLWNRESRLSGSGLYVELGDTDAEKSRQIASFLDRIEGPLIVDLSEKVPLAELGGVSVDVPRPSSDDRRDLWQAQLGPRAAGMDGEIRAVVEQFELDASGIETASVALRSAGDTQPGALWRVCRDQARASMAELARRIEPKADWDGLILPEPQLDTLRQIASHLRGRATVLRRWGFEQKYSRGLGITALFAGASGTGKTMSAEVLARSLDLDLYQIDLASTVSKYIGETEKNLKRIFDAAEDSGAILLFDEADSLFGKRTEVKDSHDRYANLEVSYLLQRMEAYRGLAILTTNMKHAIDQAFLRRIRFIVSFPFPDMAERTRIWRNVFPAATPVAALDFDKLARLNVPGGIIRNIATSAAFLAADMQQPVRMEHMLQAARAEYSKLEKPLTAAEAGGWT